MSRLKQIKEDYQIKRLNNFKEIKSLIVSIRINPLKTKIMNDVFWLKRSLIWATNITMIMEEINYKDLSISKLFDIVFLAELALKRNLQELRDDLMDIPGFCFNEDSFEYTEQASTYIEYLYMCFFQYIKDTKKTDRTIDHVNGVEFLTRYIKDKEVFEIYYMNELYHVNTIEDYLRIKETLEINKMEGEGSLVLADMMSID